MNYAVDLTSLYDTVWIVPRSKDYIQGVLAVLERTEDLKLSLCLHEINSPLPQTMWAFNSQGDDALKEFLRLVLGMDRNPHGSPTDASI